MGIVRITKEQIDQANKARAEALKTDKAFQQYVDRQQQRLAKAVQASQERQS